MRNNLKRHIILFVFAFCACQAYANLDTLFNAANELYDQKAYEDAIKVYETIEDSGYVSAELYFNIGNAYYKTHQIGPAILYYERAKKFEPNDDDIIFNLELARSHVADKIEQIPPFFLERWFNGIVNLMSSNTWALISLTLFIMGIILVIIYLFVDALKIRKLAFWTGMLAVLFSMITWFCSVKQKARMTAHDKAIIYAPSVTIRSEPDPGSTELFVLHEGTKVQVEQTDQEWIKIKLPDGKKGWIKNTALERI